MINLSLKYPAVKNRTIHSELINLIYMQRFSFYNFWSIFFLRIFLRLKAYENYFLS